MKWCWTGNSVGNEKGTLLGTPSLSLPEPNSGEFKSILRMRCSEIAVAMLFSHCKRQRQFDIAMNEVLKIIQSFSFLSHLMLACCLEGIFSLCSFNCPQMAFCEELGSRYNSPFRIVIVYVWADIEIYVQRTWSVSCRCGLHFTELITAALTSSRSGIGGACHRHKDTEFLHGNVGPICRTAVTLYKIILH